jgi:hypothetical protein
MLSTRRLTVGATALVFIVLLAALSALLPPSIDWRLTYRPATLALLHGRNPYAAGVFSEAPFSAAPWGLLPLIPVALLPLKVGSALLLLVSLIAFAYSAWQLGAGPVTLGAFLLSPPVLHCLLNGNIEWMPLLGFILPPQIGLFFVAVKPQTGFAVAIFWLAEAWHKGGWREVLRVFAPMTAALLVSFLLFGPWPFGARQLLTIADRFNASLWPMSIPVGLALIVSAIRQRKVEYAMPASPCLSPYVLFHSWSSAVIALAAHKIEMISAVIGLWVLVIIRALG